MLSPKQNFIATLKLTRYQTLDDLKAQAERLAGSVNSTRVEISPGKTPREALLRFVYTEPLEGVRFAKSEATLAPVVGRREDGSDFVLDFTSASHTVVQGQTRSGKSVLLYVALSQIVKHPHVQLWGIDPNAVLLSPLSDFTGQPEHFVTRNDPAEALELLEHLVSIMDERIADLKKMGIDKIETFSQATPLIVLVLEEFPGLIRQAELEDKSLKAGDRITPKIRGLVGRLVSESAKTGMRVVLVAQRADAEILDGSTRAQMGQRITLGVDNSDAVKMLHPQAEPDLVERVTHFKNGRCLVFQDREQYVCQVDLMDYATFLDVLPSHKEVEHEPAED